MIRLEDVGHVYAPDTRAIEPTTFELEQGKAYALLGPSGCGKTTLLNIISGLLTPTSGRVWFGDDDVTARPPRSRNIAQVFQFPVVYDTMTVFDNLAFPLRNRGVAASAVDARVRQVANLLDLEPHLRRRARGVGADLQQRISLGRGLVREDVMAVLLDEPLTVIDPHARWLLRRKLKTLHNELNVTWVYVTHDQEEALTFADEVLVMNQARVVQRATPQELFERPQEAFVGHFIGSPGMSFLPCTREGDRVLVGGQALALSAERTAALPEGVELELGVRPEHVALGEGELQLDAERTGVQDRGSYRLVELRVGTALLRMRTPRHDIPEQAVISFANAHAHFYRGGTKIDA